MPGLTRGPAERELKRLIEIFLKAETDIINEILRLRSKGNVDYHAAAALERVQGILRDLEDDCWIYAPKMIELQFYVNHPKARKPLDVPESPMKHLRGYQNAFSLTGEQTDIVRRLTDNLMGYVSEASQTAALGLESMLIGRTEPDIFRAVGLGQTALMQAKGSGVKESLSDFVETLRRDGVTAFVDKAGRRWNLHTYGGMVLRTTSRQAEVLSVLTQNEEHDLYQISSHGSTCPLCAVYEGRVYSKSGKDPNFPPLSAAFGKMDPSGPDTLENSWLNIHPNCLHQLIRWTPMGRSAEEIEKIKDFSSFEKNPPSRDPRTQKQVEAYRQKERDRAKWLRDYRQWEKYRDTLGDQVPKTFETFQKHKLAGSEKYQKWKSTYKKTRIHLDDIKFADGTTTEERASVQEEIAKIPLKAREIAERGISQIVITNEQSSHYFPHSKEIHLARRRAYGTAIHEYAHAIEAELKIYNDPEFLFIQKIGFENLKASDIIIDDTTFAKPIIRVWADKLVSLYQGRLYERYGIYDGTEVYLDGMREYFSEGFRAYILTPELLSKKDNALFEYIRRLLE